MMRTMNTIMSGFPVRLICADLLPIARTDNSLFVIMCDTSQHNRELAVANHLTRGRRSLDWRTLFSREVDSPPADRSHLLQQLILAESDSGSPGAPELLLQRTPIVFF